MKTEINEVTINGIDYVKKDTIPGVPKSSLLKGDPIDLGINIVVLQRGWIVVGRLFKSGEYFTVCSCSTIRAWGTTNGLGELAKNGKLSSTKLDKQGDTSFHELTVVFVLKCDEDKWNG